MSTVLMRRSICKFCRSTQGFCCQEVLRPFTGLGPLCGVGVEDKGLPEGSMYPHVYVYKIIIYIYTCGCMEPLGFRF